MQLFLSDDNIADVQAEYEGPGELTAASMLWQPSVFVALRLS